MQCNCGCEAMLNDFCFCKIMRDNQITKTQKYILFVILSLDAQQEFPTKLELPVRALEEFDVRGHGHIKQHLYGLKDAGYLLDVERIGRKDGYSVTTVTINIQLHKPTVLKEVTEKDEPEDVA